MDINNEIYHQMLDGRLIKASLKILPSSPLMICNFEDGTNATVIELSKSCMYRYMFDDNKSIIFKDNYGRRFEIKCTD